MFLSVPLISLRYLHYLIRTWVCGSSPTLRLSICFGGGVQSPQLGPVVRGGWRRRRNKTKDLSESGLTEQPLTCSQTSKHVGKSKNCSCDDYLFLEMETSRRRGDWLLFSVCILSCVFWMLSRLCSLRDRSSWEDRRILHMATPFKGSPSSVYNYHDLTWVCLMSWWSSVSSSAILVSADMFLPSRF